jgi:hypothetical protein
MKMFWALKNFINEFHETLEDMRWMVAVEAETDRSTGKRRVINTASQSLLFAVLPRLRVNTDTIIQVTYARNRMIFQGGWDGHVM